MPIACTIPKDWPKCVRSALMDVASLAHCGIIQTRAWCANSPIARVRLAGKLEQVLAYLDWYARFRPHQGLDGKTPEELYAPTSTAPPALVVHGPEAVKRDLVVTHHKNQPHLPIVELRKVA